jgi:chemotaxis protein methyltransferase CheR
LTVREYTFDSTAHALGISESAFTLIRDLIEERLGIFYDNGRRDLLVDKLAQLTVGYGFQSFLDYYYALKYDADSEQYWSDLSDRLAVPETYFWRQPEQFEVLARHVVPAHFAETSRPLRIWSAACCTGEEPLSIAMALADSTYFARGDVRIMASDASTAMLNIARAGLYGERSFRNLPAGWRERFFDQDQTKWRVKPSLHAATTWQQVNLLDAAEVAAMPSADVVFCRNVLIYFSDSAIERVAASLSQNMPQDGKLFLGAAESLTRLSSNFMLDQIDNAFVYINRRPAQRNA